jgi:hypothetical protein
MTKRRTRPVLALGLLAACFAIASVPACDDAAAPAATPDGGDVVEAGPDVTPSAADAAPSDGAVNCTLAGSYGSKECNACMSTSCCAPLGACYADATCKQLDQCLRDCLLDADAGGCYRGCRASYPSAAPLWEPLEKCWFSDPPKGCLVTCT